MKRITSGSQYISAISAASVSGSASRTRRRGVTIGSGMAICEETLVERADQTGTPRGGAPAGLLRRRCVACKRPAMARRLAVVTCPACGRENDPDARFCAGCGAPLERTVVGDEARKVVTIFFTDVADSTALGDRLDPELLRRVMWRYFDVVQGVLERHGGTVEKFIGDAVMAVFGVPVVREDDALRAVRAAVELGDALEALDEELSRKHGIR